MRLVESKLTTREEYDLAQSLGALSIVSNMLAELNNKIKDDDDLELLLQAQNNVESLRLSIREKFA